MVDAKMMILYLPEHYAPMRKPNMDVVLTALYMASQTTSSTGQLTLRVGLVFVDLPRLTSLRGIGGGPRTDELSDSQYLADFQYQIAERHARTGVSRATQQFAIASGKSTSGFIFITSIYVVNCPRYVNDVTVRVLGRDVGVQTIAPLLSVSHTIVARRVSTPRRLLREVGPTPRVVGPRTKPITIAAYRLLPVDDRHIVVHHAPPMRSDDHANSSAGTVDAYVDARKQTIDQATDASDDAPTNHTSVPTETTVAVACACCKSLPTAVPFASSPFADAPTHATATWTPESCTSGISCTSTCPYRTAGVEQERGSEIGCDFTTQSRESAPQPPRTVAIRLACAWCTLTDASLDSPPIQVQTQFTLVRMTDDTWVEARRLVLTESFCACLPLYARCQRWIRRVVRRPGGYTWRLARHSTFVVVGRLGTNWILVPMQCTTCGDDMVTFGYGACDLCTLMRRVDDPLVSEPCHDFFLLPAVLVAQGTN